MINRIKELFETNPKSMWTISFLLLVIFIFTPVLKSEYEHSKRRELLSQIKVEEFNWEEIQRTKEEEEKVRKTVTDEYFVTFTYNEEDQDMREDGTMFRTRWLWFRVDDTGKGMAFNYNGKLAVDSSNRPLEVGGLYIVRVNKFGQVVEIRRR